MAMAAAQLRMEVAVAVVAVADLLFCRVVERRNRLKNDDGN